MSTPDLKTTPLHSSHLRLNGRMVPFAGYSMPVQYSGLVQEHNAVRSAAGLFDVSHMGEIRVQGTGALPFLNELITGDLLRVEDGQAVYTCALNDGGTILDDLIVYRYSSENFIVVCNASNREKIAGLILAEGAKNASVKVRDESDDTALIALQGPQALTILGKAFPATKDFASSLKSFRFTEVSLNGASSVVARTGYTGEDGVEIFCANADAEGVWNTLLEVGANHGLLPAGLGCRDTLRLEARLSLYGQEIDETTNPLEAGLGWIVKLDKPSFRGKSALEAVKAAGLTRKIVGLEMIGRGAARSGYPVVDASGNVLGRVTSGSPSPTLGKAIALAYVPTELAALGTEVLVDCRGKTVPAKVVSTPFYRRPA